MPVVARRLVTLACQIVSDACLLNTKKPGSPALKGPNWISSLIREVKSEVGLIVC